MGDRVYSDQSEAYALPRGGEEKERLRAQNGVIVQWAQGLIQPCVPKENIKRVADVATGTGLWLFDVANELNDPSISYDGFDISSVQFPSETPVGLGKFSFTQHDATKPFPVEFHSQFDLINVRLLVQALKGADVPAFVANLVELLRPGGYIQWGDIVWGQLCSVPPHRAWDEIYDITCKHMDAHGLSHTLPKLVASSMKDAGLQDVNLTSRFPEETTPPLPAAAVTRIGRAASFAMLPKALETQLLAENKSTDEAVIQKRVAEITEAVDLAIASGHVCTTSFGVVTGRKGV
ncbi:hypothetical protein FQN50_002777 [Emmonsiellopsis sp. PD_5]|nr:hypothetical protein FQN50_002777 [Emmonsiellopsis sp. PD_5]